MEIRAESEHIYAGEHGHRQLTVTVENELADKELRLSFVTPTGSVYISEPLTPVNGECGYLLPYTLLDAKGVLQAQLIAAEGENLCAKSKVYCFEVERSVDGGETFDGDRLISLSALCDDYAYLKAFVEQRTEDFFDYAREQIASMPLNVDASLSAASANPVENRAVTAALNGKANNTDAVIGTAVSMGRKSGTTRGSRSVAAGTNVTASGANAQAFGQNSTASGASAQAEGYQTEAAGAYAHAEGYASKASGSGAHAEGLGTVAAGPNQHVQGKYNLSDAGGLYAHILGGGSGDSARANLNTVDWNGNAWFAGELRVGGASYAAGNKVLTPSDLSGYATLAAMQAMKSEIEIDAAERLLVTAQYDFSAGTISSFDIDPDNWTLGGEKREFVLRLTDRTRSVDLSGVSLSNLYAGRRLLAGFLSTASALGVQHVMLDWSDPKPALVYCILGFDDAEPPGSNLAYKGRRTDGIYFWISKLYSISAELTDSTTQDKYRLGAENGQLYMEEVVS